VGGYIYSYAFGGPGVNPGPNNLGYAAAASFFMSTLLLAVALIQLILNRVFASEREGN